MSASEHPPPGKPDATTSQVARQPPTHPSRATELASLKVRLRAALRQFPDFPSPGILFEDILPIFADHTLHEALIRGLELHVLETYGEEQKPDVIVGLEARGFLFGPSLALKLGASFVPVRKKGKLPGPCETESYQKEYGEDFFQMQADALKKGQKVLVVDDIIATGMISPPPKLYLYIDIRQMRLFGANSFIEQVAPLWQPETSSRSRVPPYSASSSSWNWTSSRDARSSPHPSTPFSPARRARCDSFSSPLNRSFSIGLRCLRPLLESVALKTPPIETLLPRGVWYSGLSKNNRIRNRQQQKLC